MNKYLALLSILGLASCAITNEPSDQATPVAESYFFSKSMGVQYTYSRDEHNTSDTLTYQVVFNTSSYAPGEFSRLVRVEDGALIDDEALYYYKTSFDRAGVLQCLMAKEEGSSETIVALQGELLTGSSWNATTDGSIVASVVDHYDFYYVVGREKKYEDVVVVKYIDSREAEDTYVLRYFANGFGLIHEKRVMSNDSDPLAEVSNLRLIDSRPAGTEIIPRLPDHWWDAHGRYSIAPQTPEQDEE